MKSLSFHFLLLITLTLCGQIFQTKAQNQPPSCDCCVFNEIDTQHLSFMGRIAPDTAKGQRIIIRGRVFLSDGKTPATQVLMYFYHTNSQGKYAKIGTENRTGYAWWHGYCRGWLKTNDKGEYEIRTIRPAPYPNSREPAHIHFEVKAPTQKTCCNMTDFLFKGDPFLTESYEYRMETASGFIRYGGIDLKPQNGVLTGHRDIILHPYYDKEARNSGLLTGTECPAFDPMHVWGPDKGTKACPMCKYGIRSKGVMIWVNRDLDKLGTISQRLETEMRQKGMNEARTFIIYTNPERKSNPEVEQLLSDFARKNKLKNVALAYVPHVSDRSTAFLYRINPLVTNTLIFYNKRHVTENLVNAATNQTEEIMKKLN
jgi:protocatechuate 3,4-dioxygenase beta subunit